MSPSQFFDLLLIIFIYLFTQPLSFKLLGVLETNLMNWIEIAELPTAGSNSES